MWPGLRAMTPEDRRDAAREIDALFQNGGTNIESGIVRGFGALDSLDWTRQEERFAALVLLTDGQPTAGETSREGLLRLQRDANDHVVPVFGIAFGEDADWGLIRALAADGQGAAIRVPLGEGAEVDLRRFMSALTTPVLRDVHIEYGPGVDAFRPGAPVLFAGSELLVVGTFDPARGIAGSITGWSNEGERRFGFDGGTPRSLAFLPKLVSYHRVRALQEEDVPDIAAIKELALKYSFVTDHTSLVLTLPERDVRQRPMMEATESCASCGSSQASSSSAVTSPPGGPVASQMDTSGRPSAPPGMPDNKGPMTPESSSRTPNDASSIMEPTARVPGPGLAAILFGLAALALVARRRQG
jgi:hypothetical protein